MSTVDFDTRELAPLRKVLMSEELFQALGATRVDWGEPDASGFYTPTVFRDLPPPEDDPTTSPVDPT